MSFYGYDCKRTLLLRYFELKSLIFGEFLAIIDVTKLIKEKQWLKCLSEHIYMVIVAPMS